MSCFGPASGVAGRGRNSLLRDAPSTAFSNDKCTHGGPHLQVYRYRTREPKESQAEPPPRRVKISDEPSSIWVASCVTTHPCVPAPIATLRVLVRAPEALVSKRSLHALGTMFTPTLHTMIRVQNAEVSETTTLLTYSILYVVHTLPSPNRARTSRR